MHDLLWYVCESSCSSGSGLVAAGLQSIPVRQQSIGSHTAEICCKLAGMATIKAKLNGQLIGQPLNLPIKASTPSQLKPAERGSLHCTAGLTLTTSLDVTVVHFTFILAYQESRATWCSHYSA